MHAKATAIPKTKDLPDYDDDNDDGDDDERASEMNEVSVVEGNCRRCVLESTPVESARHVRPILAARNASGNYYNTLVI